PPPPRVRRSGDRGADPAASDPRPSRPGRPDLGAHPLGGPEPVAAPPGVPRGRRPGNPRTEGDLMTRRPPVAELLDTSAAELKITDPPAERAAITLVAPAHGTLDHATWGALRYSAQLAARAPVRYDLRDHLPR